jgi:hypothetical protein
MQFGMFTMPRLAKRVTPRLSRHLESRSAAA